MEVKQRLALTVKDHLLSYLCPESLSCGATSPSLLCSRCGTASSLSVHLLPALRPLAGSPHLDRHMALHAEEAQRRRGSGSRA
ncbi:zinc finger and BTB domain-containing protein 39 [Lates japonicus]|uniref:Zinc finger and BTB domain-containing protein 39 n=1 Tax=Lates japonicus TaxID=270547 RepID=A0AAD3NG13_LATJO|nr:zinc finger and BTB domain-containing protein 39 [Lates japonicus]